MEHAGGAIRVYDDFAHHPTAVRETLHGLRARHPEGKLIANLMSSLAEFEHDLLREASRRGGVRFRLRGVATDGRDRDAVAPGQRGANHPVAEPRLHGPREPDHAAHNLDPPDEFSERH